jgi:transposase InsO family protein
MHINFKLNTPVMLDGVYGLVVVTRTSFTRFKLETGEFRELRPADAFRKVADGTLRPTTRRAPAATDTLGEGFITGYLALPPEEVARIDKRVAILNQLRSEEGDGPYSDDRLKAFAARVKAAWPDKLKLSRTTLRDWLALDAVGKIEGLAIEREKRLEVEVEDLIQVALDQHFHCHAPLTGANIHKVIRTEVRRRNAEIGKLGAGAVLLSVPSPATVHRRIAAQDDKKRIAAQLGSHQANMMYGAFGAAEVEVVPMRVIEIDHTMLDLEIVDEQGLNLGRPWLTIAIDRATRMVVGFCIGWTPPSTLSVLLTLRHMLEDRSYVREVFGDFIKGDFVRCGLPSAIVCDNGKEFHSAALRETCRRLGITLHFAARLHAHHKGKVERMFRTLNMQVIHALLGTTLSTFNRKSEYRPKEVGQITLRQLNVVLHKYLIDVYPNQWHRGLKNTPHLAWTKPKVRFVPREPTAPEEVKLLTCPVLVRPVHHYGVELFGLRFQNDALGEMRVDAKGKVSADVRFDPTDMTQVFVSDPANRRIIPALCTDPSMHGLTLWQVKALNRNDNERRAALEDDSYYAREAEWMETLGLAEAMKPGAKNKGKKALARSLTLGATPAEQLRHASLDLSDPSTFHGGRRCSTTTPIFPICRTARPTIWTMASLTTSPPSRP